MFRFVKGMIAFREAHPSLARGRFLREDVSWYGVDGPLDLGYCSHTFAFGLHGASQGDRDIYAMINAYWQDLKFRIQEGQASNWRRVIDTAKSSPLDLFEAGSEETAVFAGILRSGEIRRASPGQSVCPAGRVAQRVSWVVFVNTI